MPSEFLIQNAYVMTMDPRVGDIANGSIHLRDGKIVAVGENLEAPAAEKIDGEGMIALPGIVDTHWHMWNTLLRSFAGDRPGEGYFARRDRYGKVMTPQDMYQGTRLAAAEAINAGITTVHNWCHNIRSFAHAEADLQALRESGLRGRWSYGSFAGQPFSELMDLQGLETLHANWRDYSSDGLLSLGLAWRGMANPPAIHKREFDTARRLGLPISVHISSNEAAEGQIAAHAHAGFLGKDVQLIHAVWATPEEIHLSAKAGATLTVSPWSELRIGYGIPKASEFMDAGVLVGISVDTVVLTGNANLFSALKLLCNTENARAQSEFKLTPRRALEMGTIDGARSIGLGSQVGSLTPGKRGDIILVNTRGVNMGVFTDPAHMLIEAAEESDVDTVFIDGKILKRGGKLTALSADQIVADAQAALAGMRERAGDAPPRNASIRS